MARTLGLLLVCLGLLTAPLGAAEDAASVFESLYGRKLQQVSQTPTTADDAQFAAELLKAADEVADQPALLEVICDHAYILGLKDPSGLETALSAMTQLAEHVDARRSDALEKIAALQQRRLGAARPNEKSAIATALASTLMELAAAQREQGDLPAATKLYQKAAVAIGSYDASLRQNIRAAIDDIARQQKLTDTQRDLEAALKAEPANTAAAAKLTRLLIVDRADPVAALAPAKAAADPVLLHRVTLAAADPVGLTPDQLLDLGDWYRDLSEGAEASAKPAMLDRARVYYSAFLDSAATDELAKKKASLALAEVASTARALGGDHAPQAPAKPGPARPVAKGAAGASTDCVMALMFKGQIRVYINGAVAYERPGTNNTDGVVGQPQRVQLKLRAGDTVVLRASSPYTYRALRFVIMDPQGRQLISSQPGQTLIRTQPTFDSPLSAGDSGAAPATAGRPDSKQTGQWADAKFPDAGVWLTVKERKMVYDFSFKMPGRKP